MTTTTLVTRGRVSSPDDRKSRLAMCRTCMGCDLDLPALIRRVGYAESVCPMGRWSSSVPHVRPKHSFAPEQIERWAAEDREYRAKRIEKRKAAATAATSRKTRIQPVPNLEDLCNRDDCGHAELDGPTGRATGCDLMKAANGRSCLPCRGLWQAAVKAGIPPVGCPWRVETTDTGTRNAETMNDNLAGGIVSPATN